MHFKQLQSELSVRMSLVFAISHNFTFKSLTKIGRWEKVLKHIPWFAFAGKESSQFLMVFELFVLGGFMSYILGKTLMTDKDTKQRVIKKEYRKCA